MARRRTRTGSAVRGHASRHGRHGREGRSAVVLPPLPPLETRADRFDLAVSSTVEFLRATWPELRAVRFDVSDVPPAIAGDRVPRWWIAPDRDRVVLYRVPIERLGRLHRNDDLHRRLRVEAAVFEAAAECLGKDPWDLGPDRYHPF